MGAISRVLISHAGFVDEVSGDGCVGCGRVAALGDGIRGILSRNRAVPYLSGAHGWRVLGPADRAGDACPWLVYWRAVGTQSEASHSTAEDARG